MQRLDELGGLEGLRQLTDTFVDRCFDDMMIGFFFRDADRSRVKEMEYQHAAEWLGASIKYEGRPLGAAHRKHRIMGGQFARRLQILREVLEAASINPSLISSWLEHQESLRLHITGQPLGECHD
jgi:truncated hemoglobin YjbI